MAPVTEKDCYAVMEKRLGQKSFDVLSFSFEPFPELMGFHGAHAMLRISVKTNGKEKKYSFFVKTATKSQVLFDEYYEPMRFFFKEHILMTKVIDELQAQITKKLTAKCYLSKLNKFLVFEDLGESGFEVIRGKMLDLAHSKLAAEAFADLHAASFILEDKGARLDLEYPEIIFETFFSPVAGTDNFLMKSVDSGLRKVAKKICPYVATNVQEQVLTKLLHAIEELAKPSKKYKNVLCQGDPWGNNLMYRYQGEVPKECILVDFQTSRFAPPALELMQFLYVATEKSLSLASGLVVFASVVSDVSLERPRRGGNPTFQYRYGWSFFSAGAAFVLSELAAVLSVTAYLRRFPSPEEMVRAVVPGAERKLLATRHAEYGVRTPSEHNKELLVPSLEESLDGPLLKPDLCQTQCQSCLKEAERQMAGTTVPITVRRPRGVLHAGVLGVSDGWSSGSSPSSASPAPRPRGPPPPPI